MTQEILEGVQEVVAGTTFGVWFLIGAALVFWMQAGFAMVESGFARAKNSGNILMKNLMDFCIGTVMFIFIGFGLLLGEDILGIIGRPGFDIFTDYANFDWSNFIFNLVFCATTSTIVSGAMAERTKLSSYCSYSAIISAIINPIEAHWVWGDGWLAQIGFHDFAGSVAIHMVGGVCAIIGATMVGPRIGKFIRDSRGKVVKVNAFPGHNINLGALGVFILWLGWYGFNGAAATTVDQLGSIFLTTTVAPAIATVVCMLLTWAKYGKPDVSMCLNAALAGLVGITAGCDVVDCFGAIMIGLVSGFLVVFGVWLLDHKLHIDDPVGAVAVHGLNGIWGGIAVGLFATTSVPENDTLVGLFYGGGTAALATQCLGVVSIICWTAVSISVFFLLIKKTLGLRVDAADEVRGLDISEHGLISAYPDFMPALGAGAGSVGTVTADPAAPKGAASRAVPVDDAVPVQVRSPRMVASDSDVKLTNVTILLHQEKFEDLKAAMMSIGITGMTVTNVMGCGIQKGKPEYYRGIAQDITLLPRIQVEIVVSKVPVKQVVDTAKSVLYTGHIGDGKIFIYDVENVIKVRTGEEGYAALQDVEQF